MKRKFLIVTICLIVISVIFSLISGIVLDLRAIKLYFEITEHQYEKNASVFENEIGVFDIKEFCTIDISKRYGDIWVIEEKSYKEQKTAYSLNYDPTVNWQVDLSQMLPCGVCGNITIFSSTGKIDNSVLVAKEKDILVLLVSDDTLSPYKYSHKNFVVESTEKITSTLFETIWSDHISGEYNISYLAIDDAPSLKYIKIQPQEHPELIYSFNYYEYKGNYYSKLPFDETSNGYYDTSIRLKDGVHKIRHSDFKKRHFG